MNEEKLPPKKQPEPLQEKKRKDIGIIDTEAEKDFMRRNSRWIILATLFWLIVILAVDLISSGTARPELWSMLMVMSGTAIIVRGAAGKKLRWALYTIGGLQILLAVVTLAYWIITVRG